MKKVDLTKKDFTKEEEDYVEKTFLKVIDDFNGGKKFSINFGNDKVGFFVKENSIVIGIRYNLENPDDIEQVFNAHGLCRLIIDKIRIKENFKLGLPIIGNIYSKFGVNHIPQKGGKY